MMQIPKANRRVCSAASEKLQNQHKWNRWHKQQPQEEDLMGEAGSTYHQTPFYPDHEHIVFK